MRILFALLEIFTAAVVLVPAFVVLNKVLLQSRKKSAFYCIFSFYFVAVYALVGMPDITNIVFELTLNVIPFVGFVADWKNSVLNVLLFIPLGMMLPFIWTKYRAVKETVLFGAGMSLVIEILQIFTFRSTDINDLITNVLGTFLGFSFANMLSKKFPFVRNVFNEEKTTELCVICAIVAVEMFFVQPFISSFIYELIFF